MSKSKKYRTVILIRHGQYEEKPEKLTKLEIKQALKTDSAVNVWRPSKIVTSKMPRAYETGKPMGERLGLKPIRKKFLVKGSLPGTRIYQENATGDLRIQIRARSPKRSIMHTAITII